MAFLSLVIYTIAMLIRPHEWGSLVNEESSIVQNSLIFCMLFFLFHQNKNLNAPQLPLMVFMVLTIFLSVVAAGWIGGGLEQGELFIRTAVVPFVLISGLVDTIRRQHILFLIIVLASVIMVINGHVQVNDESGIGLMGNPIYRNGGDVRITYLGFFADPNDLGMYLVMSLPVLFLLTYKFPALLKPAGWAGTAIVLYGVYLSQSRGTLLATLTLIFIWFWRKYGTTKSAVLVLMASPVMVFILSRFREIGSEDESSQGRLDAWYAGLEMLIDNPVFGVGQGAFTEYHYLTAHNSFVLAFAEMGLLGCLVWIAILVSTVYSLFKIAERKYITEDTTLTAEQTIVAEKEALIALVMLYSLAAYVVTGFFLSRTYVPVLYLYLGMSAACLGRVRRAFPKVPADVFFPAKQIATYSFAITVGGIVAIYLIVKVLL